MEATKRKLYGTRLPAPLAAALEAMVDTDKITVSEFLMDLVRDEAIRRSLWPPKNGTNGGNGHD